MDDVKAVLRRKDEVEEEVRESSLSVQLSVASVDNRASSLQRARMRVFSGQKEEILVLFLNRALSAAVY